MHIKDKIAGLANYALEAPYLWYRSQVAIFCLVLGRNLLVKV